MFLRNLFCGLLFFVFDGFVYADSNDIIESGYHLDTIDLSSEYLCLSVDSISALSSLDSSLVIVDDSLYNVELPKKLKWMDTKLFYVTHIPLPSNEEIIQFGNIENRNCLIMAWQGTNKFVNSLR